MTYEEMADLFEKHDNEYLEGNYEYPRDLAAFNMLQKLAPVKGNAVYLADLNMIFLGFNTNKVAHAATEDDIIQLIRFGVSLEYRRHCFSIFVPED